MLYLLRRTGPSGAPPSPSLDSDHVTSTSESPTNVSQHNERDIPVPNKQETDIIHHLDNNIEPHPPTTVEHHTNIPIVEPSSMTEDTQKNRSPEEAILEKEIDLEKENEVHIHRTDALNDGVASTSHDQTKSKSRAVELHTGSSDVVEDVYLDSVKTTVAPVSSTGDTVAKTESATVESRVVEKKDSVVEKDDGGKNQALKKKAATDEEEKSEEKIPVPPPRRKRKHKKMMNKQPSLENLRDVSIRTCMTSWLVCQRKRVRERK